MRVHTFTSKAAAVREAAEKLAQTIRELLDGNESKAKTGIVLFLSGGSSLQIASQPELVNLPSQILAKITLAVVDERHFPGKANKVNRVNEINSNLIKETKLAQVITNAGGDIATYDLMTDTTTSICRYTDQVNDWFNDAQLAKIAVLGVGRDFHTAGIKPLVDTAKFKALFTSKKYLALYDAEDFPIRTTLTFEGLNSCDYLTALVLGDDKRIVKESLSEVAADLGLKTKGIKDISENTEINTRPIQGLTDHPNFEVFTD